MTHHYLVCADCAESINTGDIGDCVELGFMSIVDNLPPVRGPIQRAGGPENRPVCDMCDSFSHRRYLTYITD